MVSCVLNSSEKPKIKGCEKRTLFTFIICLYKQFFFALTCGLSYVYDYTAINEFAYITYFVRVIRTVAGGSIITT